MPHAHKEKLVSDVNNVISDSESLLQATSSEISGKVKETKEQLLSRLAESKAKLGKWGKELKEQGEQKLKQTDKAIRANPYRSVGVAFVSGLLLGVILRRR